VRKFRRDFLKMAGLGAAAMLPGGVRAQMKQGVADGGHGYQPAFFDVRHFGAKGDGKTLDTEAIDQTIQIAVTNAGGGIVVFPPGVYLSYSIHLQSNVALYLAQGATILAADTPYEGSTSGYDNAEPQGEWEPYQDFGHNHWHNSLIWGEGLHDIGIFGPGLIYGKGLSRGHNEKTLPDTMAKGVGNKAIALKNCRNVILSDFSILQGGWFGILATGVDNLTIDNLKIDTNRDGVDIDCCRNVRVSNCTVNSPWDDGICPKSSYALGYARATENLTISNCYVTGAYELGSVLDGTWKLRDVKDGRWGTGRIKCGTESNGGFKNITISNCVFEKCHGFALETVDGAIMEDITIANVTMRDVIAPFFLRLGARLRGPKPQTVPGRLKRVLISNVTSSGAAQLPSIIAGIEGHPVEDVKIGDVYLEQTGGGDSAMAALSPAEKPDAYPEPTMFGQLPATGWFVRHAKNVEMSNVEIATISADARPAFHLQDVHGADFFRMRLPGRQDQFRLMNVSDFRVFGSRHYADATLDQADRKTT
jgi:polygalacturonase